MSAAIKPPPLPSRTSSTLSVPVVVSVDTAIETLNSAAIELKDDPITFTTILDLHLKTAFGRYTFADQNKLLQSLEVLFEQNSELASDIAWDGIPLLLKFAAKPPDRDGPEADDQKAVIVRANLLLDLCANNGNSKEVFLVVVGKIQALDFRRAEEEDSEDEEEDDEKEIESRRKVSHASLSSAKILLRLLALVQKRIKMKTPSKFLTSSLMSLLSMTTKASKSLPVGPLCDIVTQIIEFVASVTPPSTDSSTDEDIAIQIKLIQAFITHGIESFLTSPPDNTTVAWWSSAWDRKIRPEKVVPKAHSHDGHQHGGIETLPSDTANKLAVGEVLVALLSLSDSVGMDIESLLKICLDANLEDEEDEADGSEPGSPTAPTSAEEIPLSFIGSLLLLAGKLNRKSLKSEDLSGFSIKIFPQHATLTAKFLPEDASAAVVDALVFIGGWILRHGNKEGDFAQLGSIPTQDDDFFLYLQKYAAISATSPEPDLRSLSFLHVTTLLHLHPREEIRLVFIKDTLEHCPFEALKAAIIGYLKDEIWAALKSGPEANKSSIFLSPIILDTLLLDLFPDYEEDFLKKDIREGWVRFNEAYSTISATANFYYLLWANDDLRNYLGVAKSDWVAEIQRRWVDVIKKATANFKKIGQESGSEDGDIKKEIQNATMDLEMLIYNLDRLDEIRQQKSF